MDQKGFLESSIILAKSRKEIIFATTWSCSLASIIAGKGFPPITNSLLSLTAIIMVILSVYVYNDIVDREMDAYSNQPQKKTRPIAHGVVSVENAMRFVYLTGLFGLGLSLYISPIMFGIAFIYYILIFLYSYPPVQFKKMYVIKTVISCLIMPTSFLIGGVAIEKTISINIFILGSLWYLIVFLISPVIADMVDAEEDLAFDIRTIGNTLKWNQNLILFNLGILTLWGSSLVAYMIMEVSYFVPVVSSVACLPLVLYSIRLRNEDGVIASQKLRSISYIFITLNPLLLALGVVL